MQQNFEFVDALARTHTHVLRGFTRVNKDGKCARGKLQLQEKKNWSARFMKLFYYRSKLIIYISVSRVSRLITLRFVSMRCGWCFFSMVHAVASLGKHLSTVLLWQTSYTHQHAYRFNFFLFCFSSLFLASSFLPLLRQLLPQETPHINVYGCVFGIWVAAATTTGVASAAKARVGTRSLYLLCEWCVCSKLFFSIELSMQKVNHNITEPMLCVSSSIQCLFGIVTHSAYSVPFEMHLCVVGCFVSLTTCCWRCNFTRSLTYVAQNKTLPSFLINNSNFSHMILLQMANTILCLVLSFDISKNMFINIILSILLRVWQRTRCVRRWHAFKLLFTELI